MDYDVVWTGAMETARRKAEREQRTGGPARLQHTHEDAHRFVLEYVTERPGATMREIQTGTCLSAQAVNNSLWLLTQRGRIVRSHRQRDDRSRPVQWRVAVSQTELA